MVEGIPLWTIALVLLIIFCGYMALRAIREDYKQEQEYIEREGKVYMDRIQEARSTKSS
ncbi:sporulation YhaL family protein [Pontibacillus sp. HMF3514]|uniref:sporulation YhaL family protein n=1 Tax=Pontibacillus sp. HMF3514 TaxID=2692425 RepID=UPI00131F7EFB|nr:sporulation YhaL family protein [Pontibacillus sp. HMF3514]QHE51335.1 SigE-dependent sporulation protein [Pontibacillus sp. HMF3514]